MTDTTSSNKRIAKNTLMLYFRMLLSMGVSLYTSRVVLNTLGVEDYGIYGVVGGVVAMFSFLNTSMSGATSRFLTYEMGRNNKQQLNDTFSSALIIHIGIAITILLLAETLGLWFLNHKLVIPEERMDAANWVFQLSILSMTINVTQVPYNASIISHEKMDVYAYVEIANVTLKLLIVYLLTIGNFDKLILYAVLLLGVSITIAFTYRIYCIKNFQECRFKWIYKPSILKPMLSFSGWDLYGNMSYTFRQQGVNMLINMGYGPIMNAASNVATTVQGVLLNFLSNITTAFKPQIIKKYAEGDIKTMSKLIINSLNLSILLFCCTTIPAIQEASYILKLWLINPPIKSIEISQIILAANILTLYNLIIAIPIHATGNIRYMSLCTGSLFLSSLIPMYLLINIGTSIEAIYYCIFLFNTIALIINLLILKKNIPRISIKNILLTTIIKYIPLLLLSIFIGQGIKILFPAESFIRLIVLANCIIIVSLIYFLFIILEKKERKQVISSLSNRIKR